MLTKEEIKNNINTEWQLPSETQKEYRYSLCKFILNISQRIGLSFESSSLAMLISNYFFIKNLYFNYNKLTMSCAALLLSSKKESSQNRFNEICREYLNNHSKGKDTEGFHKIREHIGKYEILLLKQLNYNIPEEFPYDLIYAYSELLYPDNDQEISNIGIKIAHDSYFTYANNIYKNYIVALSCLIIAAKFMDIPTILEENFKNIDNMKKIYKKKNISEEEFIKALIQYDNQSMNLIENHMEEELINEEDGYFEKLSQYQKLFPNLKLDDLTDCVVMIMEFYEDMNSEKDFELNNNK